MVVLPGIADKPSREVRVISLGNLVAEALLTVMVTVAVVDWLPALSFATAVMVWEEFVRVVVSRLLDRVPDVVVAKTEPSMLTVTKDKPEVVWPETIGSEAEAETVMAPLTVPAEGEVMETVGAVVSGADWVVAEAEED